MPAGNRLPVGQPGTGPQQTLKSPTSNTCRPFANGQSAIQSHPVGNPPGERLLGSGELREDDCRTRREDHSDADLLGQFACHHDQQAFAELVRRHGPLVMGVCRRVLGHQEDAEDAFQACFLLLARKVHSIRRKTSLASWLYQVAYRTALKARSMIARRHEQPLYDETFSEGEVLQELARRDLAQTLDEELSQLPVRYRAPLVLCYLAGKTQSEVAEELGLTQDALRGRLERARRRLGRRLALRGLSTSVVLGVGFWSQKQAAAAVSPVLVKATSAACWQSACRQRSLEASPQAVKLAAAVSQAGGTTSIALPWVVALLVTTLVAVIGARQLQGDGHGGLSRSDTFTLQASFSEQPPRSQRPLDHPGAQRVVANDRRGRGPTRAGKPTTEDQEGERSEEESQQRPDREDHQQLNGNASSDRIPREPDLGGADLGPEQRNSTHKHSMRPDKGPHPRPDSDRDDEDKQSPPPDEQHEAEHHQQEPESDNQEEEEQEQEEQEQEEQEQKEQEQEEHKEEEAMRKDDGEGVEDDQEETQRRNQEKEEGDAFGERRDPDRGIAAEMGVMRMSDRSLFATLTESKYQEKHHDRSQDSFMGCGSFSSSSVGLAAAESWRTRGRGGGNPRSRHAVCCASTTSALWRNAQGPGDSFSRSTFGHLR